MKIRFISKPFLMPFLMVYYILQASDSTLWVILGLIGGFLGDVFLMIPDPEQTKKFFRLGLISFLLGHIFYIVTLLGLLTGLHALSLIFSVLFIIYGIIVYNQLIQYTGKMKMPVTVYILVIILMGVTSGLLWNSINTLGFVYLILGATIFILSDTINAFNKFKREIPFERIYTMSTYLLGQFLLILGFLNC